MRWPFSWPSAKRRAEAAPPPRKFWHLPPGTEIAPGVSVIERLGGSTAEIYRVEDKARGATAVAKLLRPDRVQDKAARARLKREVEIVSRLEHPAIVRCLGLALDTRYPHALFEPIAGMTLARRIKSQGALAPAEVLPVARAVASALVCLAEHGIVHLDLKPGNILLGPPPRLIDFGLARPVADAGRIAAAFGTARYMAPEQCDPARFPGTIGPSSDIWGFGVTLYYAVRGRRPFARLNEGATTPEGRYEQLRAPAPPLPAGVSLPLADLIGRMLRVDPAARPTAVDVLAALDTLAGPY